MKLERIVALVPMRHDSKRVPGKNYRSMCGKPLYAHIIKTLLNCPEIAEVVVDTDGGIVDQNKFRHPNQIIGVDKLLGRYKAQVRNHADLTVLSPLRYRLFAGLSGPSFIGVGADNKKCIRMFFNNL